MATPQLTLYVSSVSSSAAVRSYCCLFNKCYSDIVVVIVVVVDDDDVVVHFSFLYLMEAVPFAGFSLYSFPSLF